MSVVDSSPPLRLTPVGRLGFARHEDVDLFVQRLEAFERGELSADDWRSFRLLNGVYGQRQDGVMMIRAKLPAGIATPAQLRRARRRRGALRRRQGARHDPPERAVPLRAERRRSRQALRIARRRRASRPRRRAATPCATGRAARSPASPRTSRSIRRRTSRRSHATCCAARTARPCRASSSPRSGAAAAPTARRRSSTTSASSRAAGPPPAARPSSGSSCSPAAGCRRCGASALTVEEFVPRRRAPRGGRRGGPRVPPHRQPPQPREGAAQVGDRQDRARGVPRRVSRRARRDPRRGWRAARAPAAAGAAASPRRARAGHRRSSPATPHGPPHSVRPQKQAGFSAVVDAARARRHHRRPAPRGRARSSIQYGEGEVRHHATSRTSCCASCRRAKLAALHRELARARAREAGGANSRRRRDELPGRVELQARGDRLARPRRRAHRAARRARPRAGRRGARPRHQGVGLPARLRPALHRRHRLPGRDAQAGGPARAAVPGLRRRRARVPTAPSSAG